MTAQKAEVGIALLFPELLGTYGDGGNATVLAQRLRWRGTGAEVVEVRGGDPVPESADIYLMGGGEDGPQALAARTLAESGALGRAADRGAAMLAVCAGFQVLGRTFVGPDGAAHEGLGLLDCVTTKGEGPRRIGEIVVEPNPGLGLPPLTGYENHGGVTALGEGVQRLGTVAVGRGNDTGDGSEGAVQGHVLATYLHGPVLARNPAVADLLLSWVGGPLEPLPVDEVDVLRQERLSAAGAIKRGRARRWSGWAR